jgi:hypothetical protein
MNTTVKHHRRAGSPALRLAGWLGVIAMLAIAILGPSAASIAAATPTGGATSDLKGIASSYTNVLIDGAGGTNQDTVLSCNGDTATQFTSHISFHLSQTAPAGSFFRVYLTPNGGAQLSPAGVDITANQGTVSTAGLTAGDHTLPISLNVTTSFSITSGGVLLVIADDASGAKFNSKSNSLNCTEAETPPPTPTNPPPTPTNPPPTPTNPPPTPTNPPPTPTNPPPTPTNPPPAATPTTAPTGEVEAAVGTPRVTLPPTDTVGGDAQQGSGNWRILLIVMAGLLTGILALTPKRARR